MDARAGFAGSDAEGAEARVAAVMKAAADAITAEVEAQAVMKETEFAIKKATSDIEALSPTEDMYVSVQDHMYQNLAELVEQVPKTICCTAQQISPFFWFFTEQDQSMIT